MPVYAYYCSKCGLNFDCYCSVDERNEVQHCGQKADRLISLHTGVHIDSQYKDAKGSPIYFPKVGSYYDKALNKTFHSKKQKWEYMKEHKLIQDGSKDKSRKPIEAGSTRFERVR